MTRRRVAVLLAAFLSSAGPALAQPQGVTGLPRSALGVLLVLARDDGPIGNSGNPADVTNSSAAAGLWADVTLLATPRVGLHVGFEIPDWVDHQVLFSRSLGLGGSYYGSFQHKDFTATSFLSFHPVSRIRPIGLLGAGWVHSRYVVWDPNSSARRRREETAAAPALLVGVELPVNPNDRVTFTVRVHGRFVAWLPEVKDDGFRTAALIVGAGLQFRLK